jgi:uncharacterized RDD family membrane protein YckC
VRRLRDACVDGRLSVDELALRAEAAYSAKTLAELAPLIGDLPHAGAAAPPRLASWPRRAAALFVDQCVLAGSALILGLPATAAGSSAWALTVGLISIPLSLTYFTLAHGSRRGQTIGDSVNGIAVRSDALRTGIGGRASYGQAFGRTVMIAVFLVLFVVGGCLDFLWPLWDRRRQAWHDKVAGTIVVRI